MANVIDRLRVQGNPAPRNLPPQPDSGLKRVGGRSGGERGEGPHTMQFVLNHSHLQTRDSSGGRNMNQAARRLEHLQRIQLANQGISSMDSRQPDLPGKQFMLRGKPASADTLLHRQQLLQQQQQQQEDWKSASAASGKSAHAILSRAQAKNVPEHNINGILPSTRSELREVTATNGNGTTTNTTNIPAPHPLPSSLRPPYSASATSYFLLAKPHTLHPPNSRSAQTGNRQREAEGKAGQGLSGVESTGVKHGRRQGKRLNSAGSAASFELTGHQMVTPRSNTGYEDNMSFRDLYGRSPRLRSGVKDAKYPAVRDRRSPGLKDATTEQPPVDPQSLRQCLHVQHSTHPDSTTEVHKHLAQFSRAEAKINYNNPYRQTRSNERRPLPESERRYIFDSVASYIHFNKIYPNSKDSSGVGVGQSSPIKSAPHRAGFQGLAMKDGVPKVPHLTGFPKHCTDTILLRMMFELNRPGAVHGVGLGHQAAGAPSMKSSDSTKYSDIGRHRDLDEFTIQGETPSLTSHRQQPQQQQQPNSGRGGGAPVSLPSHATAPAATEEERKGKEEAEGNGHRIAEEEEEEEDNSTLITATTPGRQTVPSDEAEDADDEASQWNVQGVGGGDGGGGRGKGKGGRGGRKGRAVIGGIGSEAEEGYVSSDSSVGPLAMQ